MTAYRGQIKARMGWLVTGMVASVAIIAVVMVFFGKWDTGTWAEGYILGVQVGLFFAMALIMARFLMKYSRALKNDAALDALYRSETDERNRYIQDKTGGIGMNIVIGMLGMATILAGFFNQTVFFTLLGSLAAVVFVKAGLKGYYWRKV